MKCNVFQIVKLFKLISQKARELFTRKGFSIKSQRTVRCHNPHSASTFCAKRPHSRALITRAPLALFCDFAVSGFTFLSLLIKVMKRAKKRREKSLDSENIDLEEDKSGISRRQEKNFDQELQGIVHTRTHTLVTLISLGFPHFSQAAKTAL